LTQRPEHLWLLVHLSIKRKCAEGSHPFWQKYPLPADRRICVSRAAIEQGFV